MKKTMYKLFFISILLISSIPLLAYTLTGNAPQIVGASTAINDGINTEYQIAANQLKDKILKNSNFSNSAKKFGKDSAHVSYSGSYAGFLGYDLFALMINVKSSNSLEDDPYFDDEKFSVTKTNEDWSGNIMSAPTVQLGINGNFITENLYLTLRWGALNFFKETENGSSFNLGFLVGYNLIKSKFKNGGNIWRGINIETGFIYQSLLTKKSFTFSESEYFNVTDGTNYTGDIDIQSTVDMSINSQSLVIPFHIATSLQTSWIFNFSLGTGFDLNFTSTDFLIKSYGVTTIRDLNQTNSTTDGNFSLEDGSYNNTYNFISPKVFGGFGFSPGPLFVDFQISYYLRNKNALAIELAFGVVW